MVIRDHQNEPYIVPGGRRGVRRNCFGYIASGSAGGNRLVGKGNGRSRPCPHSASSTQKRAGYPYPHPDFVWAIFSAQADSYDAAAIEEDAYVTRSSFQPVAEILSWQLSDGQHHLLQAAVQQYTK